MQTLLLLLLRAYKLGISPFLGVNCRFYPTCSEYAAEAVRVHGSLRGSAMAAARLCKCHPWHEGGLDPVPPNTSIKSAACCTRSRAASPVSSPVPPAAVDGRSHS